MSPIFLVTPQTIALGADTSSKLGDALRGRSEDPSMFIYVIAILESTLEYVRLDDIVYFCKQLFRAMFLVIHETSIS